MCVSVLADKVSDSCPRLLINRELVGLTPRTEDPMSLLQASMQGRNKGFQFDEKLNYRCACTCMIDACLTRLSSTTGALCVIHMKVHMYLHD